MFHMTEVKHTWYKMCVWVLELLGFIELSWRDTGAVDIATSEK